MISFRVERDKNIYVYDLMKFSFTVVQTQKVLHYGVHTAREWNLSGIIST